MRCGQYAQTISATELDDTTQVILKIDKQKVAQTIAKIEAALKDKPVSKQEKQKLNYAKNSGLLHWTDMTNREKQTHIKL